MTSTLPKIEIEYKVRLLSLSGWQETDKNQVYKTSHWEVKNTNRNNSDTHLLQWEMNDSKCITCTCCETNCPHSSAVQSYWEDWQNWSEQKNADDLARELTYFD